MYFFLLTIFLDFFRRNSSLDEIYFYLLTKEFGRPPAYPPTIVSKVQQYRFRQVASKFFLRLEAVEQRRSLVIHGDGEAFEGSESTHDGSAGDGSNDGGGEDSHHEGGGASPRMASPAAVSPITFYRMYEKGVEDDTAKKRGYPLTSVDRKVPFAKEVAAIIRRYHCAKHLKASTCRDQIWRDYYMPGATALLREFESTCLRCQQHSPRHKLPRRIVMMQSVRPFQLFKLDTLDMGQVCSVTKGRYTIAVTDHYTGYLVAIISEHKDCDAAMCCWTKALKVLKQAPSLLWTDNGREFNNTRFHTLVESTGCIIRHGKPYDPRRQGKIERINRELRREAWAKNETGYHQWGLKFDAMIDSHNRNTSKRSKVSPAMAMRGDLSTALSPTMQRASAADMVNIFILICRLITTKKKRK